MPLLLLVALVLLAIVALIPISIVQRYRAGTSRQRARGWLIALNLAGLSISVVLLLASAAITSVWVADALTYTAAGLALGAVLGVLGLRLTRWESAVGTLHYRANAPLVLAITLVVAARVLYGFWRAWTAWRMGANGESWLAAAGVAGSMGAGAVVLGYYFAYWLGVRRRLRQHLARPVRRL